MIVKNLLEKIGYTPEMQKEYEKFRSIADKRIIEYTKEYINGECSMVEIQKKIDAIEPKNMSLYTMYLIFVLECTGWLKEKYLQNGRTEEMFVTAMKDIAFKTAECRKNSMCSESNFLTGTVDF